MINQFNINLVVEGTLTKMKEDEAFEMAPQLDPYEIPKKLGKYERILSVSNLTTEKLVERIIENRMKYLEIYKKKAKKEEVYYQNQTNNITEI